MIFALAVKASMKTWPAILYVYTPNGYIRNTIEQGIT